jgi:hypothetical protein
VTKRRTDLGDAGIGGQVQRLEADGAGDMSPFWSGPLFPSVPSGYAFLAETRAP